MLCASLSHGLYTSFEAPKSLQLSLIPSEKTAIIMSYLHTPTIDDDPTSRVSLVYKVFATFVSELYATATQRGFGMPNNPGMTDIPALMVLARDKRLDVNKLEPAYGTLRRPGDLARMHDMAATPEVA